MPYNYNINPAPTGGQGAFGLVPGQVGIPDPYEYLKNIIPNLPGLNTAATGVVGNQLGGKVSPQTTANMWNLGALSAGQSGMPGSNAYGGTMPNYLAMASLGHTTEGLQQTGLENYNKLIPTIAQTQTVNPALLAEIAATNAVNAAAPSPQAAYERAKADWLQGLAMTASGPGGGTRGVGSPSGGTGMPSAAMQRIYGGAQRSPYTFYNNTPSRGYGGFGGGGNYGYSRSGYGGTSEDQQFADWLTSLGLDPSVFGSQTTNTAPWDLPEDQFYYDNQPADWSAVPANSYQMPVPDYYDPYEAGYGGEFGWG